MARHLSLRKTTRPDRAPADREVVFIDQADGHLKAVDDEGQIADLEQGGSGVQSQTAEITTDPDTFVVEHALDLGGAHTFYVSAEVTALDGDGEVFSESDEAGIACDVVVFISRDGIDYAAQGIGFTGLHVALVVEVGDLFDWFGACPRFIKVQMSIVNGDGTGPNAGEPYAGANHPSATATVTVEY